MNPSGVKLYPLGWDWRQTGSAHAQHDSSMQSDGKNLFLHSETQLVYCTFIRCLLYLNLYYDVIKLCQGHNTHKGSFTRHNIQETSYLSIRICYILLSIEAAMYYCVLSVYFDFKEYFLKYIQLSLSVSLLNVS